MIDLQSQFERIEQRAIERDLIALLSPRRDMKIKAQLRALRLRELLKRMKDRCASG